EAMNAARAFAVVWRASWRPCLAWAASLARSARSLDSSGRPPCPATCACLFCAFMVGAERRSCRRKSAERKRPELPHGLSSVLRSHLTQGRGGCGLVEVSFASWPGSLSKANEDFVAASPSAAVVLDGLSPPSPLGTGCLHGTPWYVAQLGVQVMSAATTAGDEPLQDLVASAIMRADER